MTTDPRVDMISFTGSTASAARRWRPASATLKKVSMELGGKNPAAHLSRRRYRRGARCRRLRRLFQRRRMLQRRLAPAPASQRSPRSFVAALAERAREVPRSAIRSIPRHQVGAIISADHLGKIEGHVAPPSKAGANVRAGGERLASNGLFMAPTIVDERTTCNGDRQRGSVRPGRGRSHLRLRSTKRSRSPTAPTTASPPASGAATSTRRSASAAESAPARCGPTRSWTARRNCRSAATSQSGVGRELGRNAVADYTEEKTFHVHNGPRTSWWLPRGA